MGLGNKQNHQKNTEDKREPPELKKLTTKNKRNNLKLTLVTVTSNSVFPGSSPVTFLVISNFYILKYLLSSSISTVAVPLFCKSDFFFKLLNTEPTPSVLLRTNISFSLSPSCPSTL